MAVKLPIFELRVPPKQVDNSLILARATEACQALLSNYPALPIKHTKGIGYIDAIETQPVNQRHKAGQPTLRYPHACRQAVWPPVRPAHAASRTAACKMGPLHVPKVLVVERLGQGYMPILETVYWSVLRIEKGPGITDFAQGFLQDPTHAAASTVFLGSSMVPCS